MKFKKVLCTGHPRSGTHYISALISVNFLQDRDYFKIYRNHEFPDLVQDPDVAYVHIWREFVPMAQSIYVLKERFGLCVDSFSDFLNSRYRDMWHLGDPDTVITNARNLTAQAKLTGISDFFKDVNMTPREFWAHYNERWMKSGEKHPNVFSVKYDDMVTHFQSTMASIAQSLGSEVKRFENIDQKVGWWK